jgi:hypothetical protein
MVASRECCIDRYRQGNALSDQRPIIERKRNMMICERDKAMPCLYILHSTLITLT